MSELMMLVLTVIGYTGLVGLLISLLVTKDEVRNLRQLIDSAQRQIDSERTLRYEYNNDHAREFALIRKYLGVQHERYQVPTGQTQEAVRLVKVPKNGK